MIDLADYDFALPETAIAQAPAARREDARLLVLDRKAGTRSHRHVSDLPALLRPGDLVVGNATRVRHARLRGHKASGGRAEALLLGPAPPGSASDDRVVLRALVRCRGRLRPGLRLGFPGTRAGQPELDAEITGLLDDGEVALAFPTGCDPYAHGEMPLPPYIRREAPEAFDEDRYQTVFARSEGSVAAPTAGLHLTHDLLDRIRAAGARWAEVVLHIGVGTFRPIRPEDLAAHALHEEAFEVPEATARAIAETRAAGGRVVAVGTTVTRTLEHAARQEGGLRAGVGRTRLLLAPGDDFRVVDALLTNFHLPRSSLLLLVCAFAGRETVLSAYAEAIEQGYRFYSYGDAMLLA